MRHKKLTRSRPRLATVHHGHAKPLQVKLRHSDTIVRNNDAFKRIDRKIKALRECRPTGKQHQLRRWAQQQQQLYRLADTLNQSASLESAVYEVALDAIVVCLHAQRASILLLDPDEVMRFKAWRGLSKTHRKAVEGHSPWPPDARDPQPVCIENIAKADVCEDLLQTIHQEGIGALCFIPLVYQGRLLGKFMAYFDTPHSFTTEDLRLAETIANQLAIGLDRKKSDDALRDAKDRLANQAAELERLVTERTQELQASTRQLEAFVYSIAHDLRAPLRAMEGFAAMLVEVEGPKLSENGRDFARRISKSARFMDALLLDLLTFSRVSQQRVQLVPVDLQAVLHSVLSHLESELQQKRARVRLLGPWPSVLAHEPTLSQILINLLSNALKFVAPGVAPLVSVRTEDHGAMVRVWIEDNGIGIAPEHQQQIFRLFTRLGGESYPGTGIGLAIVQKGIEHFHGRVGVESTLGKGSRFWFELQRA